MWHDYWMTLALAGKWWLQFWKVEFRSLQLLHCALVSYSTVYCNRSCLWVCLFVGVCVCLWVCYHDNSKLRASILTKLIKFWPSCATEKGVCGGAKIFGSALLQPARSVCVSLIVFSFRVVLTCDGKINIRLLVFARLPLTGVWSCVWPCICFAASFGCGAVRDHSPPHIPAR